MSTTTDPITIETPVGPRTIRPDQPWWKGNGRGITREFISQEVTMTCRTCNEDLVETAFPTLTVPRKDGRTRGLDCRECRDAKAEDARKRRARSEAAKKAAATRAAKKAKVTSRKAA